MRTSIVLAILLFLFSAIPLSHVQADCVSTGLRDGRPLCSASKPVECIGNGIIEHNFGNCCDAGDACPADTHPMGMSQTYNICDSITDPTQLKSCRDCMGQTGEANVGTWTAIGCITTNPDDLLGQILGLGMGVAGGLAFLLILFGGIQIMTSAGNPEQLSAGRELVSSAITGLLLIIFSIFLLQFIGVKIIGIPGFGSGSQDVRTIGGPR